MISGAARLATEKAVFRPALPMSFTAGLNGQHMATKLNYKEQLQHPNWQRKRLEVLEAAGFECSNCGEKDKMLHVHHKRYIKGRQAWEYEVDDLAALCEDCHEDEHDNGEGIKTLLAEVGSRDIFSLSAGFHHHTDWIDRGNVYAGREANALAYAAGFIAYLAYHLDIEEMDRVAAFAVSLMNDSAEPRMVYVHKSAPIFGRDE